MYSSVVFYIFNIVQPSPQTIYHLEKKLHILNFFYFTEVYLIYNVVLISAV